MDFFKPRTWALQLPQVIITLFYYYIVSFVLKLIFEAIAEYLGPYSFLKDGQGSFAYYFAAAFSGILWLVTKANSVTDEVYNFTGSILRKLHDATVVSMVRHLYLNGPKFQGWAGTARSGICAELTKVPADHWQSEKANIKQCDMLIESGVWSNVIILHSLLIFILFIKFARNFAISSYFPQPSSTALLSTSTLSEPAATPKTDKFIKVVKTDKADKISKPAKSLPP